MSRFNRLAMTALIVASSVPACRKVANSPDGARPNESTGGVGSGGSGDGGTAARGPRSERVEMRTPDGWTLAGDLTVGALTRPAVILVHQLSSNRHEWAPLVERLHRGPAPFTTLAIDARGHGESTRGPDGTTRWQQFGNDSARWDGMRRDFAAAVAYVSGQHLDANGFVFVGSSIGSTAAVRAAADERGVRALVMLSPGLDYRGLDTVDPLVRYVANSRPVFLVAGDGDTESLLAVNTLARRARELDVDAAADAGATGDPEAVHEQVVRGTGAHGVSMAAAGVHPALWDEIAAWLDHVTMASAATVGAPHDPALPGP
jgi:pimeloyl-ACP methyl ester carboxylesterase